MDKSNPAICPYCLGEMTEGYIPFNTPIHLKWNDISRKEKTVLVSDSVKLAKINKISKVYYCVRCQVMAKQLSI
ncbi:MAG: PF20097 family protein [Bacilli bacterium]|nr:PF20097 family protein [Bacilli bacterium]